MITPVLISRIGWRTYLIFTLLLASFVPGVWYFYPETSGLSLEEVDNLFLPPDRQNEVVRRNSLPDESHEDVESGKGHYAQEVEKF